METTSSGIKWTPAKKILFLFFGAYFVIGIFPFPFKATYYLDYGWVASSSKDYLATLFADVFFSMPSPHSDIIGEWTDHKHGYVYCVFLLVLALFTATALFTFFRNKINFDRWFDFTRTYLRYYLGLIMLDYGFSKLLGGQFSELTFNQLEYEFGEYSRMEALWAFMSASPAYVWFTAIVQIAGAYLIFFRKTMVLGVLVIIAVMLNIVVLNICYDVTVKLFSMHLLLIGIFILLPDVRRLYRFFILHQASQVPENRLYFSRKVIRVGRLVLKAILIVVIPIVQVVRIAAVSPKSAPEDLRRWQGSYSTELFVLGGDTLSPGEQKLVRWEKFRIEGSQAIINTEINIPQRYDLIVDTVLQVMKFTDDFDTTKESSFAYKMYGSKLILEGNWEGKTLNANFRRKKKSDFPLLKDEIDLMSE